VEFFKFVELFADSDELNGLSSYGLYAQRSSATGITVQLCKNDTIKLQTVVELLS